jgi:hypothetical protein
MNTAASRVFSAKLARRRQLAALSFDKKIVIVEKLRDLALATAPFRARHVRSSSHQKGAAKGQS